MADTHTGQMVQQLIVPGGCLLYLPVKDRTGRNKMLNMKYPKGPVYDPQTETSNHKRKFPWRKGGSQRLQTSPVGSILAKPLTGIPGAERRQTLYNIFNKGSKNAYKPIEREEIIETHTPGGRAMSPLFSQFSKYRQYFRRVATRLPRVASATSSGSDATAGAGATSSSKDDEGESQEVKKPLSATEAEADARLRQLIRASAYSYGGIDVVKLFQHYDRDNSGELDMDEFLSALRRDAKVPRGSVPDEQLRDVFYRVDTDNSGTVDTQEFAEWLQLEIVENEEVSLNTQQLLEQRALRTRCKKCFVSLKLPHVVDPPSMQRWSESFQSCLAMCRRVMAMAQKRADHDGRAAISPIRRRAHRSIRSSPRKSRPRSPPIPKPQSPYSILPPPPSETAMSHTQPVDNPTLSPPRRPLPPDIVHVDVTPASVFAQLSEEERVTCRLLVASEDEDWALLMDLMRKYERYFKVQLEGTKALWFHSNPAQMGGVGGEQVAAKQETLRQAGGPQALVRAGNRFYREVTLVQPWLVGALVHLAEGSARVQNFLINAGAIQLLLKLMKRHPHHEKIVDVSCTCLRMVIGTAIVNVQFARNLGLGRALVKALHDHPHPIETAWQDRSVRPMLRTMKINIRKAMKRFRKELKAKEKRKQELREAEEDEDEESFD